jgi:sugar lactone lactonase YvrE
MTAAAPPLPPAAVFDGRACDLGEGALWHPVRRQLLWFDITGHRLMTMAEGRGAAWQFDRPVSAAGWIDRDRLLVAASGALLSFGMKSGTSEIVAPLDCADGRLRPNDGRADPWGGFWIGTMGIDAAAGAGAIWRYHRGEMRRIRHAVTIPNAICFSPDGGHAFFTDTPGRVVFRQRLREADGWPQAPPEPWLDLRAEALNPDGAVIDAEGRLWLAQWGAGRVAVYDRLGRFEGAVGLAAPHASCPAFGGTDLSVLFVTSALSGMDPAARAAAPQAGMTFAVDLAHWGIRGQPEHRVVL